jgi:hypothetical protein
MAWGSTAPAAMAGLVTLVGGRVAALVIPTGGTRPVVKDGAQPGAQGTREAIDIGYQDDDHAAVEWAIDIDESTTAADLEHYTVNCAVRILKARDMVAARTRAFELLALVGGAIKGDRTLGGAVMTARITSYSLEPTQSLGGALAPILFGVTCTAWTTE